MNRNPMDWLTPRSLDPASGPPKFVLAPIGLITVLLACGGSTPRPGAPVTSNPSAPEWVLRGTQVAQGDVFGVGGASGIKNTELARTTAANRGRAEISKVMEVYSTSLMKDYQSSTSAGGQKDSQDEQSVSQAIKTFSANLLSGTEVKEYWLDAPAATWYALVDLNFERAKAIAAANVTPGTREWLDRNGRRVLDELGTNPNPPAGGEAPAPTPLAPNAPRAPPEPSVVDVAPIRGGQAPGWTRGVCDAEKLLCGVGDGPDRASADLAARVELARIFKSNIQSVVTSFEGANRRISSAVREDWVESQQVTSRSMVSSEKVVTMSEIRERWDDGHGRIFSLAVIVREAAMGALRDQIQQQDGIVQSEISRATATDDKLSRFKSLKAALAALEAREAMNSDLRVLDRHGRGIPAPHDLAEILDLLESAGEALSIGVVIAGSGADRVQACLQEGLTSKGYRVQGKPIDGEDTGPSLSGDFDVLLKGSLKSEQQGVIAGSQTVEVSLAIDVINGKNHKIVRTLNASRKASRADARSAASTAAVQLCAQQMQDLISEIDRTFSHAR